MMRKRIFSAILGAWLVLSAWPALAGIPGTQKWVYPRGDRIAVGPDGTVYITQYSNFTITAITPAGDYRWDYSVYPTTITTFPVIGENGTVYFGDGYGGFHARNANGTFKWDISYGISIMQESAIGAGGYIYTNTGSSLARVQPDATTDKVFTPGVGLCTPPAIGPDGTVYVGTTDAKLCARNPDLTEKWTWIGSLNIRYLAVGFDGTLYYVVGNNNLYAFRYGVGGWVFTAGGNLNSAPVIGPDGTIYVGCADYNLYAINPEGSLKWTFLTKGAVSSTPAVGADGIVYVGSSDGNLYAVNPDGSMLWKFTTTGSISQPVILADDGTVYVSSDDYKTYAVYSSSPGPAKSAWPMYQRDARHTGNTAYKWVVITGFTGSWVRSSPALRPDGTIYVGDMNGRLYAISPEGTIKWSYNTLSAYTSPAVSAGAGYFVYVGSGDKLFCLDSGGNPTWPSPFTTGGAVSSPAVCADGNVVVGSQDHKLYKVNVDTGTEMWHYTAGSSISGSPVIGPDGTIYIGSDDAVFHAVTPAGVQRWTHPFLGLNWWTSAAIGAGGTVYVGAQNKLYAFNPDGYEKWPAFVAGGELTSSPAIGPDGTIYVGCDNNKIYAINANLTYKWAFPTGGTVASTPAIGADGLIYVGSTDNKLYVLNPNGSLAWAYPLWDQIWSSPAIAPDGTVYVGADLNFHAFYSTSPRLAKSAWPMFRHDPQHTGRWAALPNLSFLLLMLVY